jgi:hypothetical protein
LHLLLEKGLKIQKGLLTGNQGVPRGPAMAAMMRSPPLAAQPFFGFRNFFTERKIGERKQKRNNKQGGRGGDAKVSHVPPFASLGWDPCPLE